MVDSAHGTMTVVQMQALADQMGVTVTPAMVTQMQQFANARVAEQHNTTQRLPVDASGKAFTRFSACVVQQPVGTATVVPPTLVGNAVTVIGSMGERVRVRYLNGEERDFHSSELGIK